MSASTEDTLVGPPEGLEGQTLPDVRRRGEPVSAGTIIGRYVVVGKLGAGAMGVVLAAYDPQLDRKIALKLLKPSGRDQELARTRLRREAQALAKLAHPNVVAVHDVGEHGGQIFVAMEFVEGQTLREWMAAGDSPRPWREVVRVFCAAGRGLAAAHSVELVHRDFKPDNVMIGADGRVRVMDFGLARATATDDDAGEEPPMQGQVPAEALLDSQLTRTGSLLGTPAYMAAERFAGASADALSDQFSFCVALYEGLYGQRPFAGERLGDLWLAIQGESIAEPSGSSPVPLWLRRVVVRGLRADPQARYPGLEELLGALAEDPVARRRQRGAGLAVVAAVAGLTWWATSMMRPAVETCSGAEAKLEGVWDAGRRGAVKRALESAASGYGSSSWERVEARLDDYTGAWAAIRREACEATERGEQSGALLDARMACLDDRIARVEAIVDVLVEADETVASKAVEAVSELSPLGRCADLEALRAEVPPPEDESVAREVGALHERLLEAEALRHLGKYEDALAIVEDVVMRAAQLDYPPLQARTWIEESALHTALGDYAQAEAALVRGYEVAVAQRMSPEAAEASAQLVFVVGSLRGRMDEARRWALDAKPMATAAGTESARALYLVNVGALSLNEGDFEAARGELEASVEAWTAALGPEHPRVGASLSNLGVVAAELGRDDEARGYYERSLAIYESALGPDHPDLSATLNNLGSLARAEGDHEGARRYLERSLRISKSGLGTEHPSTAFPENNLGSVALEVGDYEEARRRYENARRVWEKSLGAEHPQVGLAMTNLGSVAQAEGNNGEARAYFERACALMEKGLGPEHPMLAHPLGGLGQALLADGEAEEATGHLRRAVAIWESQDEMSTELASVRFALARALWDGKGGAADVQGEAVRLAEQALAILAVEGEGAAEERVEVERWLEKHLPS